MPHYSSSFVDTMGHAQAFGVAKFLEFSLVDVYISFECSLISSSLSLHFLARLLLLRFVSYRIVEIGRGPMQALKEGLWSSIRELESDLANTICFQGDWYCDAIIYKFTTTIEWAAFKRPSFRKG